MNVKCKRWKWVSCLFVAFGLLLLVTMVGACSDTPSKNDEEMGGGIR